MKRTTQNRASSNEQTLADKMSTAAHSVREQVEDLGAEVVDQAKQKAGHIYEQANKSVNEQYERAMDYGRENPGKSTLIAFGVGFGFGLLVAGSIAAPRSRRGRMAEPIVDALSNLAYQLIR